MKTHTNLIGRFFIALVALLGTALLNPSANAGAPLPLEPIQSAEFSFTGFYIGANVGATWSNFDFSDYDSEVDLLDQFFLIGPNRTRPDVPSGFFFEPIATFTSEGHNISPADDDSFIGGVQVGFQKQFGHFVVGVEGDFNRTSTKGSNSFTDTVTFRQDCTDCLANSSPSGDFEEELFSTTDFESLRQAEMNWNASARLRVGYAKGPLMLYATGGAAFAQVKVSARDTARTNFFVNEFQFIDSTAPAGFIPPGSTVDIGTISNTHADSDSDIMVGWTAGGGAEYAINDMITIGLEYRHSDYGGETFSFGSGGLSGSPTTTGSGSSSDQIVAPGHMHVDMENDQITFRVNVLLNRFFGR